MYTDRTDIENSSPTRFVLTGGEMECWLDDTPLKMNRVYRAEIGKVLKFGKSTLGFVLICVLKRI